MRKKKIDDLGLKKDDLKKSKTKEETIEKMLPEETKKVMDKKKNIWKLFKFIY